MKVNYEGTAGTLEPALGSAKGTLRFRPAKPEPRSRVAYPKTFFMSEHVRDLMFVDGRLRRTR